MRLYYSSKNGYEITYQKSNLAKKYDKSLLNNQMVKSLGDLDHNGIKLFVINARNSEGCQYYQVINPKDLSVRFCLMESGVFNWGESFALSKIDFNHDGSDDLLFNGPNGDYSLLSGKDGKVIVQLVTYDGNDSFEETASPMDEIVSFNLDGENPLYQLEDINGDGSKELGYFYYGNGYGADSTKLKILDGNTFEQLKLCSLGSIKINDPVIIPVQGQTKVILKEIDFNQIYDYQNETLVAGTSLVGANARGLNDGRVLIETSGGQLYAFNDQSDFSLVDFEQENLTSGDVTVKYKSEKAGMLSVYDHGSLIGQTTSDQVSFTLLAGEHDLVFSYDDANGKMTHITKKVTVSKSSGLRYIVMLISLLLVLISSMIVFYPKYHLYKKAGIKHGKAN